MTDQPGAQGADSKLAVLLERSQNTERVMQTVGQSMLSLNETLNRVEKTQIQTNENLTARSEANRVAIANLDAKVDHKDQASIARDQQQVAMIREEEAAREEVALEQKAKHDADIAGIRATIKEMSTKLDNAVFWSRIMAGVASFATVIAGLAFSAWLRSIVP